MQTIGRGKVQDAQWSPDGQWFAVLTSRAVWLYPHDKLTDEPISLDENESTITSFTFIPNSQSIVTGDVLGNVIFWDIAERTEVKRYHEIAHPLYAIRMSPNEQLLAYQYRTDDYETAVHLWDLEQEEIIAKVFDDYGVGDLIFIEDNQILLMSFTAESDGGAESNIVGVDTQTGEVIDDFETMLGFKFAQSSDGDLVFFNYSVGWYGEADTVWLPFSESGYFDGYVGAYQYAISADSQSIYMLDSTDNLLKYPVANLKNEDQLPSIQYELPKLAPIALLSVNPVTDMVSIINHLGEGYHYANLNEEPLTYSHFNHGVQDILVFEDILIVLETQNYVEENGQESWSKLYFLDLAGHHLNIPALETISRVQRVALASNRHLLAISTYSGHIYLVDLATFEIVQDWRNSDCPLQNLDFSSVGFHLAYIIIDSFGQCEESANANVWHIDEDYNYGVSKFEPTINYRARGAWEIAFSPNDEYVAIGLLNKVSLFLTNPPPIGYNLNQSLAKTYSAQEDKMFGAFHEIEFSTDNRFVVAGGVEFGNGWLGSTDLWISENQSINGWTDNFFRLEAHTEAIWGIAISSNNDLIASASQDGTVMFFSTDVNPLNEAIGQEKYRHLHTLPMYGGANDVVFSADGQRVIVAVEDGTIRIWGIPQ